MNPTTSALGQLFSYFSLREDPFHVSPNQRFYFSTNVHDSALVELLWGLESRQGLLVLTGQAGTGKTTLINRILRWLEMKQRSSAYVFHTCLEPVELLELVLRDFGIPYTSSRKVDLIAALHQWVVARNAAGDSPVLILDEAQVLSISTLDELRLLLNLETDNGKLLQIVMAGQLELEEKLRHPELHQLRQRVMIHSRLSPLTFEETRRYISSRLSIAGGAEHELFPLETVKAIHACSRGIPRLVNLLCKDALVSAYVSQQHVIPPSKIYDIALELGLSEHAVASESSDDDHGPFGPVPPRGESADEPAHPSYMVDRRPHFFADAPSQVQDLSRPIPAPPADIVPTSTAAEVSMASIPPALPVIASEISGVPELTTAEEENVALDGLTLDEAGHPPIVRYWADASDYLAGVSGSFLRDCRLHVQALSRSGSPANPLSISGPPPARKGLLVRVSRWLRGPMTPPDVRGVTHPVRATSPKHF